MKTTTWKIPVLALLGAIAGCSGQKDEPVPTGTAQVQASHVESSDEMPAVKVEDLGVLVDLIVAEANELPYAEFDPAALAKKLGKDPRAHFEWVRDHTSWAPYRGLLRGPKGVMLDRVGSNLDRAVLLGDLLRRSGHTVRLAHAQLSEDRAHELLGRMQPMPDQHHDPIAPRPISVEWQHAAEVNIPGLTNVVQEQINDSKQRLDEAKALVRAQADQLHAIVRGIATKSSADERAAFEALRDYWWVEREEDGNWIAMDAMLPDSIMGKALAEASDTSEWNEGEDAPAIPETNWHAVQVRVVVERYESGATTESILLETTLRPAKVFDRPITLMHTLRPWPDEPQDLNTDKNAIRNAALEVREWVPFLRIGDDIIAQSGVTDAGDLIANPFDSKPEMGGSLFGGFDSALGGGEDVASYATAEWIDYEIIAPGESNQRLRRPVFDLLGPAKRAAAEIEFDAESVTLVLERFEALWGSTDILLQPCNFTEEFFGYLISSSIVANQKELRELSQERDPAKASSSALTLLGRIDIWGPLPEFILWRSALSRQPADWFVDRPNVLNYRVTWPIVQADGATLKEMIDVASNGTGIRRGASEASFETRLAQGVSDTVAEVLALGSDLREAENTASVFAMTTESDRGIAIAPRDSEAVRGLNWPVDAAARLAETVDAGFMAVALKKPILLRERQRVGWWRVDPNSGETIGVMDTGYHAADEYSNLVRYKNFLMNWATRNAKRAQYAREIVAKGGKLYWKQSRMLKRYDEVIKELAGLATRGI